MEIIADVQEQPVQAPIASQVQPQTTQPLAETVQVSSIGQDSHAETYEWSEPTNASLNEEPAFDTHTWSDYLSTEPQHIEHSEETIVSTLEDLEQNLLSQGFVPLEPNSLSAIAQSQEQFFDEPHEADTYNYDEPQRAESYTYGEEMPQEEDAYHAPTLSSALEQLGNLAAPHAQTAYSTPESFVPAQSLEEPLWVSGFRTVPAPLQEEVYDVWQERPSTAPALLETPDTFDLTPVTASMESQEQQFTLPNRVEALSGPIFEQCKSRSM